MRWTRSPVFVAAFVVVDVLVLVLAYLAIHREGTPGGAAAATPETPTTSAAPASPIIGPLSLTAAPGGALMRATRGTCDKREPVRARVWVAPTYRSTLARVSVPGLQEVLGAHLSDRRFTIVGADTSCKVHGYVSTDGGRSWRTTAAPRDIWYLDTDTTAFSLHGPVAGGVVTIDCRPVAVTTVAQGARALVSCDGFNVVDQPRARDVPPITYGVDAPAAAALQPRRTPLILATSDTCLASLRRVTSQADTRQVACLGKDGAPLGLAVAGDRIFAQVGLTLRYSPDGGRTFADYPRDSVG